MRTQAALLNERLRAQGSREPGATDGARETEAYKKALQGLTRRRGGYMRTGKGRARPRSMRLSPYICSCEAGVFLTKQVFLTDCMRTSGIDHRPLIVQPPLFWSLRCKAFSIACDAVGVLMTDVRSLCLRPRLRALWPRCPCDDMGTHG